MGQCEAPLRQKHRHHHHHLDRHLDRHHCHYHRFHHCHLVYSLLVSVTCQRHCQLLVLRQLCQLLVTPACYLCRTQHTELPRGQSMNSMYTYLQARCLYTTIAAFYNIVG